VGGDLQALLPAQELVEVSLASTGLSGELYCLFLELKNLKVDAHPTFASCTA
jgi:hypothetical protein